MNLTGKRIGNYEILQEIGSGGMAVVYQAYDHARRRVVALKILPPHLQHNSDLRQRFLREGQEAGRLVHPNIVRVYEAGEADGYDFIAMEYLAGGSLAQLLRRRGRPLEAHDAANIMAQIAGALDYAYAQGILHRDLKPSNILLDGQGRAVLSDFGIAKIAGQMTLTPTGAILGTVMYMSPEQARGRNDLDQRSDIFALGAILYEMLAGQPPFQGEHDAVILRQILDDKPTPPRKLNPAIPPETEQAILTAMQKDRNKRYKTAWHLAAALQQTLSAGPWGEAATQVGTPPSPLPLPQSSPGQKMWPYALVGAVVVLVAFAVVFWPRTSPQSTLIPTSTLVLLTHAPVTPTKPKPATATPKPAEPLPVPNLIKPENGTTEDGPSVTFEWSPVSGASQYRLETRSERSGQTGWKPWGETFTNGPGLTLTFANHTDYFHTPGTEYSWRVAAVDGNGQIGVYSEVWRFIFQRKTPPLGNLKVGMIVPHPTGGGDGIYLMPAPKSDSQAGIVLLQNGARVMILADNIAGGEIYGDVNWHRVRTEVQEKMFEGYVPASMVEIQVTPTRPKPPTATSKPASTPTLVTPTQPKPPTATPIPAEPLPAPNLLRPDSGATESGVSVTFEWSPVSGASQYRLETRSERPGQSDWRTWGEGFTSSTVLTLSFASQPDYFNIPGTLYFWRVAAVDANGQVGVHSEVWAFIFQRKTSSTDTPAPPTVTPEPDTPTPKPPTPKPPTPTKEPTPED